jgi:NAD(P)-dependent dehydrogenase (short-subunit alcohol dehydrogenase family)
MLTVPHPVTLPILNKSLDEVEDFSSVRLSRESAFLYRWKGFLKLGTRFSILGRLGEPEDVAGIVSYLAGPDGQWVTGSEFDICFV